MNDQGLKATLISSSDRSSPVAGGWLGNRRGLRGESPPWIQLTSTPTGIGWQDSMATMLPP